MVESDNSVWRLDCSLISTYDYQWLRMVDKLKPYSWIVTSDEGTPYNLSDSKAAQNFFEAVQSPYGNQFFISVDQNSNGQHQFISMNQAQEILKQNNQGKLTIHSEDEVKKLLNSDKIELLYARPESEKAQLQSDLNLGEQKNQALNMLNNLKDEQSYGDSDEDDSDNIQKMLQKIMKDKKALEESLNRVGEGKKSSSFLSKAIGARSGWSNYSIIPEISLDSGRKMILCDENSLCQTNGDSAFTNLRLIVNCHERQCDKKKYKIGSCSTKQPPEVIVHAVHEWHSWQEGQTEKINKLNHSIQEQMWKHQQKGSVAVHCLAGIHRAACIMACQFLYRHYALGHKQIPAKSADIYKCLVAVRPAVSPAYTHVLDNYQNYLQNLLKK